MASRFWHKPPGWMPEDEPVTELLLERLARLEQWVSENPELAGDGHEEVWPQALDELRQLFREPDGKHELINIRQFIGGLEEMAADQVAMLLCGVTGEEVEEVYQKDELKAQEKGRVQPALPTSGIRLNVTPPESYHTFAAMHALASEFARAGANTAAIYNICLERCLGVPVGWSRQVPDKTADIQRIRESLADAAIGDCCHNIMLRTVRNGRAMAETVDAHEDKAIYGYTSTVCGCCGATDLPALGSDEDEEEECTCVAWCVMVVFDRCDDCVACCCFCGGSVKARC